MHAFLHKRMESDMNYWIINTDAAERSDVRTCDLWFKYGMAFSGGDWDKYALPLGNIELDDICFMYHNGLGIVGVGKVLEVWDGKPHTINQLYINQYKGYPEYRLRVDWYADQRVHPINPRTEFGYNSSRFLQRIIKHYDKAAELISKFELGDNHAKP